MALGKTKNIANAESTDDDLATLPSLESIYTIGVNSKELIELYYNNPHFKNNCNLGENRAVLDTALGNVFQELGLDNQQLPFNSTGSFLLVNNENDIVASAQSKNKNLNGSIENTDVTNEYGEFPFKAALEKVAQQKEYSGENQTSSDIFKKASQKAPEDSTIFRGGVTFGMNGKEYSVGVSGAETNKKFRLELLNKLLSQCRENQVLSLKEYAGTQKLNECDVLAGISDEIMAIALSQYFIFMEDCNSKNSVIEIRSIITKDIKFILPEIEKKIEEKINHVKELLETTDINVVKTFH